MKTKNNLRMFVVFLTTFFVSTSSFSQNLQVDGNVLKDTNGNTIVLRGVNYPIIDDYGVLLSDYTTVEARIDQVALTGSNCIRFPWYTNGTHYKDLLDPVAHPNFGPNTLSNYVTNGHLSHLLQYTRSKGMIPVLEIHNFTGNTDNVAFQNVVMDFWTSPEILQVIDENKEYLIINLANEFGYVNYAGNPTTASIAFRDNYITSITSMRNAGVHVPIMIDAPDYGQSSSSLVNIAPAILVADIDENILFSVHAYWAIYANTVAQITAKMNEMSALSSCAFLLGEVANTQADAPTYCGELDISTIYPTVLNQACVKNIGWLAWSWDQDCDQTREMSNNATFSNLTAYGNDIVNNSNYGLKSTSGCGAIALGTGTAGIETKEVKKLSCVPNPVTNTFYIQGNTLNSTLKMYDLQGKLVFQKDVNGEEKITVSNFEKGIYLLKIEGQPTNEIIRIEIL